MKKLFNTTHLGSLKLENKIIMAPMSRNRATNDGLATDLMATYYAQRASAGMIISEGIQPSVQGQGFMNSPGLHSKQQKESWRKVTHSVHNEGGLIVAQLMHSGRIGHPSLYESAHQSVAPSAIAAKGQTFTPNGMQDYLPPKTLSQNEIKKCIQDFVLAARNAIDAGFDGVEIHAGNGFLLHQFMASNTNIRTDAYGGSIENRNRFVIEVTQAVANAIGADKTGIRISPNNPYNDIEETDSEALYNNLITRLPKLAFLHVMEANNREQTLKIRHQWQGPFILNPHKTQEEGAVTPEIAEQVLKDELAEAVCFGSLFIANPDLVNRIKVGAPFNTFDAGTFYGGDHRGYTDYPNLMNKTA
ncbi:alkene reductase [uncultured Shewanella sp.]|uniref:alkene reductase n=1 Tax=uncultured Shewanella sp. TaxID=173975 RepID=UPI002603D60F|nr:alkene reductase [uncultured Shewanella sp.]